MDVSCHRGHALSICLSCGPCHHPQAEVRHRDSWHCGQPAEHMDRVPLPRRLVHARRCRTVQQRSRACRRRCLRRGGCLHDCRGLSALAPCRGLERNCCTGLGCAARPCAKQGQMLRFALHLSHPGVHHRVTFASSPMVLAPVCSHVQPCAPATARDSSHMRCGRQHCRAAAVLKPALEGEHPRGDLQSRLCHRRQRL
jgi:hypothetical protein